MAVGEFGVKCKVAEEMKKIAVHIMVSPILHSQYIHFFVDFSRSAFFLYTQPVRTLFLFKSIWTSSQGVKKSDFFFFLQIKLLCSFAKIAPRRHKLRKIVKIEKNVKRTLLERIYKSHYDYQNFSPLANGKDLNRQKYAILQTHWH